MLIDKFIRALRAGVLLASVFLFAGAQPTADEAVRAPVRLVFQAESTLEVEGTSTIHDWTCEASRVVGFAQGETAGGNAGGGNAGGGALSSLSAAQVSVPVAALDCDNGTMNGKLREALKGESAPTIRYDVSEASLQTAPGSAAVQVRATGRLTMAGATRTVTAQVKGERLGAGRYRFTGVVPLDMTRFGIDPPTAMFGTLKTGKDVKIRFEIVAQSPQTG